MSVIDKNSPLSSFTNNELKAKSISQSIDSILEPMQLFSSLTKQKPNCLLLESSEIVSQQQLKSLMILSSALRIECNGNQVLAQALTVNGENALALVSALVAKQANILIINKTNNLLSVEFASSSNELDESQRLKASSPIDLLRLIRQSLNADPKQEYAVFLGGVFAFDFIANFEKLPQVACGENSCPDYVFYLAETLLVIDHTNNSKRLVANHFGGELQQNTLYELSRNLKSFDESIKTLDEKAQQFQSLKASAAANLSNNSNANANATSNANSSKVNVDLDDQAFAQIVLQLKQNIIQGDAFQVVPSRTFSLPCPSPIEAYKQLKASNPSPYMFFMQDADFNLFGASPESALKYEQDNNKVMLYPIAGTRPRGKLANGEIDKDLDARIEVELKQDSKETAEHMMLVDLARNDIARVSKPATTQIPRLLAVDRYSQVMHLVSCVEGELSAELDALNAYQACMNMGTLSGAPKIKASQLIRQVEGKRRGSYGGAVGYLNGRGDMDTCIVIRSAFCQNDTAYIQAGAGVVFDSDPSSEAAETEAKARAVINAVIAANRQTAIIQNNSEAQV